MLKMELLVKNEQRLKYIAVENFELNETNVLVLVSTGH